jgi:hypothetical protein
MPTIESMMQKQPLGMHISSVQAFSVSSYCASAERALNCFFWSQHGNDDFGMQGSFKPFVEPMVRDGEDGMLVMQWWLASFWKRQCHPSRV